MDRRARLQTLSVLVVAAACGTALQPATPDDVEADDMSAAAHRRSAAEHERRAQAGGRVRVGFPVVSDIYEDADQVEQIVGADFDVDRVLSPADERERAAARRHREAAAALERLADETCSLVPAAQRGRCPLEGRVVASEEVEGGIHLRLGRALDPEALDRHARCHMALARVQDEGDHVCPLQVRGAVVDVDEDGAGLTILAPDAATAAAIRERATD